MKDTILTQLETELSLAESKADSLRHQIRARKTFLGISQLAAMARGGDSPRPEKKPKRPKAPPGVLGEAIEKAIRESAGGLTKKEVGEALKASRYGFSVTAAHISRKLGKMHDAKRVVIEKRDQVNVYKLPTP